jgi:predicted aminopeptidase
VVFAPPITVRFTPVLPSLPGWFTPCAHMRQPLPAATSRRRLLRRGLLIVACWTLLAGCKTARYYQQAVAGQYEILARREPIETVLSRTNTSPALREQLQLVLELRRFAATNLHLPIDGQYAKYADLGRRHVVWNVYAAPEFSLEPRKWWYPVVGRQKYRGYFSEPDARACGVQLAQEGYDVYVGGVDAYSTLGWFKDPVLNTFIHDDPAELAELLFHELAHQRVFAPSDTDFNEAFATTVGEEGARRWLASRGDTTARAAYEAHLRRDAKFVALVLRAREELQQVYGEESGHKPRRQPVPGSEPLVAARRADKAAVLDRLRSNYEKLKISWGGYAGYDPWFQRPINNAQLNTVATYYTLVPAFQRMLANHGGHLQKFYAEAKATASLPKEKRQERMAALGNQASPVGRPFVRPMRASRTGDPLGLKEP